MGHEFRRINPRNVGAEVVPKAAAARLLVIERVIETGGYSEEKEEEEKEKEKRDSIYCPRLRRRSLVRVDSVSFAAERRPRRTPTRPFECLQSLGKSGVHPRLMHESFTLEIPSVCARNVKEVIAGDVRRPCAVVCKMYLHGGVEEGVVVEGDFTQSAAFDAVRLSADGVALRDTPNAGGASVRSEVMSMEILKRAFGATLLATEMQAWYWPAHSPITDYVCTLNGETVGVSVTRAFHFVSSALFTAADARRLLAKKLQGVLNSTKAIVYPEFKRQVLHVFCRAQRVAELVLREYRSLGCELRGNTVLFLTVCEADWIYTERALVPKKVPLIPKKSARQEKQRRTGHRTRHRREKRRAKMCAYRRQLLVSNIKMVLATCALAVLFALMLTAALLQAAWMHGGAYLTCAVSCLKTEKLKDT